MPVGLEIGIDLGVDDEDARRSLPHPGAHRLQVAMNCSDGRCLRTMAARDRGEVGVGERTMSIGVAPTPVEVHLGGIVKRR